MRREIKFRAWEKHAKRMAEVTTFKWQPDHLYHQVYTRAIVNENMIDEWYAYEFGGDSNGITIMQYTGLKDKNGKEIYEGDIVRYLDFFEEEFVTDVSWVSDGTGYWPFTSVFYPDNRIEVIGNVYENPELERSDD